ncbi:hypothetical protein C8R46DRAFT_1220426 [Mycena filopes]|nr:hypothetical protein C8R46DRAFT_1220426 [Mycena filopes]
MFTRDNFAGWPGNFEAYAGTKGLWHIRSGEEAYPASDDANAPTRDERRDLEAYRTQKSKASREIWLAVEELLRDDLQPVKGDPKAMLEALDAAHNQKVPGVCFAVYNNFLNITLCTELEPAVILTTLVNKINNSLSFICRQ